MLTHDYLYYDNTLHGSDPSHLYGPEYWNLLNANKVNIWEKFVKLHPNIMFVFSGHVHSADNRVGRLVSQGDHGNKVYQFEANYQQMVEGGQGFLRLVQLNPTQGTIAVQTYSPYLNTYLTDDQNQFEYQAWSLHTNPTPRPVPAPLRNQR